ncbi:cation:proton antiporter [Candidatus Peregrinibacteria bacterium]|nr:cation:proton antiporter [Candidatus Peregrinibacteria bacterium]
MEQALFLQLSLLILTTCVICLILKAFRQPIMIGYLIAGLLLSPNFLNVIKSPEGLSTFSQIGISLLLFMVGLGLNPQAIKETGKSSFIAALSQIIITFAICFGLSLAFGFNIITSVYIGLGLSFSSTIVIMKMLGDKLTLDTLPGKISIGILILKDLTAMLILMVFSAMNSSGSLSVIIVLTLLKAVLLLSTLAFFSIKILPRLTASIAKSQELLLLFSMAWCMTLASIFYALNFSIEIGALLAGISLSYSPYRHEISAKMRPIRDFFLVLFFVIIGSEIYLGQLTSIIPPLIVFTAVILILNPLIITIVMGRLGYTKKTSFLTAINFSQLSEFSLILASLGLKLGHLDQKVFSLMAILSLLTITGSTYFINFSEKIYRRLSPALGIFEKGGHKIDQHHHLGQNEHEIMLFGYATMGQSFLESFKKLSQKFLIVDYDPKVIDELNKQKIPCLYGDASNLETFEEINFQQCKMVISTIKDLETNLLLIDILKNHNPQTIVITLAHRISDALKLYEEGSDYVIMPFQIGGHHTSTLITEFGFNPEKFSIEKNQHISTLLIKQDLPRHHH